MQDETENAKAEMAGRYREWFMGDESEEVEKMCK